MKLYLLIASTMFLLIGCASSTWKENDFFIGGHMISLSPADMGELRGAWSNSAPFGQFKTALTNSEAQWTADFISLRESLRNRNNPCRTLNLESVSPSPVDIADLSGRRTPGSQFDEKWSLDACGVKRAYRAYHPQYSIVLAIDEVRP